MQDNSIKPQVPTQPLVPQEDTPPQMPSQPATPPTPAQAPQTPTNSGPKPLIMALLIVVIIAIAGGTYVLLSKNKVSQTNQEPSVNNEVNAPLASTPPTETPITTENSDQSLEEKETDIQKSLEQADSDIESLNNINAEEDNPNSF